MKLQEKITTFVKKHKKPIIITSATAGGIGAAAITYKYVKDTNTSLRSPEVYIGKHAILSTSVWNDMMDGIDRVITVEGEDFLLSPIVTAVENNL